MQRFLVAFAARDAQTEKIGHHIARKLEDARFLVRLIDIRSNETEAGADDCDAVILAGSAYRRQFDPSLGPFIMRHGAALRSCPSAFAPISLAAASHDPSERAAIDEVVQDFLGQVGWKPDEVFHVAGAIEEPQSGLLDGSVLAALFEPDAGSADRDTARETELTDWPALDGFIRAFSVRVASQPSLPVDRA
ncbi:flavodoxin domain-containing protein [Leptospira interrogans]